MGVLKFSVPEIFFGRESLKYSSVCARRLGAEKIFFVTDPGLEQSGWIDVIFEILEEKNLGWVHYSNVSSNPRDWQIEQGAELYQEEGCDVVIALGGGSPMDAAKGIALVASNGGRVHDYEGANRIQRPLPPMIFMPSTAGSGSDISQFAIVTDVERHVKMSIISRTLVPNISIIDPILLTTKSRELIISSAIDAFAHAVESYLSPIAFPVTEIHSLKAMELIIRHLPRALETGCLDDLEQLSIAGTSAAMAFSNAGLGVDHALAHSLGGMLDVVHGLIHPVLLSHVMRFNMAACPEKVADIGRIILGKTLTSPEATARAGIERLESYFASLGVATRLRDIVSSRVNLSQICEMAIQDSCVLSNPRKATVEDMMGICEAAW
ncbi:iron-containing alcohol dehydrogenase [Desulfoluna spongiiphila]|uniref:Alcohol dehydrogenase n=1 Tax=Desulfoluna spongiiphila TaxID=419481 RepID=A0A1G5H0W6_9BACT|nr:iron-containing alcohol dehydrogenase [Desulfoluna spongiiphila]SCY57321.1 alcohol dehydrogenase [Desulfoluna spongiiphila]VVS94702.1 alcohol dehydrogenase iron-type/glycerol dehydrogenase glda [Desulfoluna spongiiphila]